MPTIATDREVEIDLATREKDEAEQLHQLAYGVAVRANERLTKVLEQDNDKKEAWQTA